MHRQRTFYWTLESIVDSGRVMAAVESLVSWTVRRIASNEKASIFTAVSIIDSAVEVGVREAVQWVWEHD